MDRATSPSMRSPGGALEGHRAHADATKPYSGHNHAGGLPEGATQAPTGDEDGSLSAKSHHKQTAPVYRLPSDILSFIFEESTFRNYSRGHWYESRYYSPDLFQLEYAPHPTTIARVSRHWREIALDTPTLWTQFDHKFRSQAHVDLHLARSEAAPLYVTLYQGKTSDYVFPAIVPHISRIRFLALDSIHFANALFHSPAPLLERLRFSSARDNHLWDEPMFAGCTPRLRHLDLSSFRIPLASPIYTGLVNLALQGIRFQSPVGDLLGVLGACPKLERLQLIKLGFLVENSSQESLRLSLKPIDLPVLGYIFLYFNVEYGEEVLDPGPDEHRGSCMSKILQSIIIPPTAHLEIDQHDHETFVDLDFLVSHAQRNLKNIGEIRAWRILEAGAPYELRGSAKERGPPLLSLRTTDLSMKCPTMFLQPATQPVSHRFETLEIFFTPPDITSRRLGFVSPFANDYISMLSSLPHLKKLALPTHPPCHLLPDALIATPTSYICPELAELCLYESSESVSWDTVLAVVKSRTDPDIGGVSLRELTVPRYVRSDDKVVGLSAYVRVKAPA